jgi:hypothetical protein
MVVHARTEEGELATRVGVPLRQGRDVREHLLLGQRRLEIELTSESNCFGQVTEQLVDGRDADRPEHLLPVRVGEREKRMRLRHWSARTCR